MNNYRYDKLNAVMHLENQKSHYYRILNARKNINFDHTERIKRNLQSLSLNNKYQESIERDRVAGNKKLVEKIKQIHNQKGLLEIVQNYDKKKKGKSMYETSYKFHKREKEREISQNNKRIASKLSEARPIIGNKSEWNHHFKEFRQQQKYLKKHKRQKQYDPTQVVNTTELLSSSRGTKIEKKHRMSERETLLQDKITKKQNKKLRMFIRDYLLKTEITSRVQTQTQKQYSEGKND